MNREGRCHQKDGGVPEKMTLAKDFTLQELSGMSHNVESTEDKMLEADLNLYLYWVPAMYQFIKIHQATHLITVRFTVYQVVLNLKKFIGEILWVPWSFMWLHLLESDSI